MARKPVKAKKTSYIKFGSTTFNIPAKMIGYDKKGNMRLYKTTTKRHNLTIRNGVPSIVIKENPNKSNIRITRVPRSTVVVKKVVRSDTKAHTQNNPIPNAPPQSASMSNPMLIPARAAPAPAPAPAPVPDVGNRVVISQAVRESAMNNIKDRIKMKIQQQIYKQELNKNKAATIIQGAFRNKKAIDRFATDYVNKNDRALRIQTAFRERLARKKIKQIGFDIQEGLKTGVRGRPVLTPERQIQYDKLDLVNRVVKRIRAATRKRYQAIKMNPS